MKLQSTHLNLIANKIFLITSLGLLIGEALLFSAINPFWSTRFITSSMEARIYLAILIPSVGFFFCGPFLLKSKNKIVLDYVQLITLISSLVIGHALFIDFNGSAMSEWKGAPLIMEFGYYIVYSKSSLAFYFLGSIISSIIATSLNLIRKNTDIIELKHQKRDVFHVLVGIFSFVWVQLNLMLNLGVSMAMISWNIALSILSFIKIFVMIKGSRDTSNGNEQESSKLVRNGKSGFLNIFKLIIVFFPIVLILLLNAAIAGHFLVKPNILPSWLEYIPIVLIAALAWGLVYLAWPKREIFMISSAIIGFVECSLIISATYSYDIYFHQLIWLSAFSSTAAIASAIMYMRGMVSGFFSRSSWASLGTFSAVSGLLFSFLYDANRYEVEIARYGIVIIPLVLIIAFTGLTLSKMNGYWNKNKRNIIKKLGNLDEFMKDEREGIILKSGPMKRESIAIIFIILTSSIAGITANFLIDNEQKIEQVVGSFGQDYFLWQASSLRTIDAHYRPNLLGSPRNSTVHVSLARGEHEGIQVIFTPWQVKNLNLWTFEPKGPLVNKETKAQIDEGNITIYLETYVDQLSDQFPDRLIPFQRLDTALTLDGQRNWPFYIDVHIPRNDSIDPGIYTTQMLVKCLDYHVEPPDVPSHYKVRTVLFTLEVEVYNFTVPLERHVGTEIIWGIPDTDNWINFYNDHRLDAYWPQNPIISVNTSLSNLTLVANWTKWENDVAKGFARGMKYFPITYHPPGLNWTAHSFSATYQKLLEYYIGNVSSRLANKTTPWGDSYLEHAYFFVRDEPGPEHYQLIIDVAKVIHAIEPRLRIMETMNQDLETYPDEFLEEIDIYCQHVHRWHPAKYYPRDNNIDGWPERLGNFVKSYNGTRQKELWVYHTHNRFPTPDTDVYMSGVMQRNSFWLHWIYNATGWLYWSFNWGMDRDGGYGYAGFGESTLVGFGENDSPISSIRLERVRDGAEDFEYFYLLNKACSWLENNSLANESTNGRELLREVRQTFNQSMYLKDLPLSDTSQGEEYLYSYNPYSSHYLTLRNLIGEELGRIYSLGIVP
ncbi:MAG: glycoside hydrolase domain-containing protein [Promethearchaeota archaeon]